MDYINGIEPRDTYATHTNDLNRFKHVDLWRHPRCEDGKCGHVNAHSPACIGKHENSAIAILRAHTERRWT